MTARVPPPHIVALRDAVARHVEGVGPDPGNCEELDLWYLTASNDETLNEPDIFFAIGKLELSDDAIRWERDIEDDSEITDEDRIAYAREMADEDTLGEDVYFIHDFDACDDKSGTRFFCCTAYMTGNGGYELNWHGYFDDKASFRRHLNSLGYFDINDGPFALPDVKILEAWKRG